MTEYDIALIRGNSASLTFEIVNEDESPVDLTGSTFILKAKWGSETLTLTNDSGISIPTPTDGMVVVAFTVAQSRVLPIGRLAKYELERQWSGGQRTYVSGYIKTSGGVNDD